MKLQTRYNITRETKKSRVRPAIRINAYQKRSLNKALAAVAASYLPVGSYVLAHVEAQTATGPRAILLWSLVAAALIYSAPTLAQWAQKWCGHWAKAWGLTLLLEGVMVASHIQALSLSALLILVSINAAYAWSQAK